MDWIHEHWGEITVLVGLIVSQIVGYSELKGRMTNVEKRADSSDRRHDHTEQQLQNLESGLVKEISEVKQSLARIEGFLKGRDHIGNNS